MKKAIRTTLGVMFVGLTVIGLSGCNATKNNNLEVSKNEDIVETLKCYTAGQLDTENATYSRKQATLVVKNNYVHNVVYEIINTFGMQDDLDYAYELMREELSNYDGQEGVSTNLKRDGSNLITTLNINYNKTNYSSKPTLEEYKSESLEGFTCYYN